MGSQKAWEERGRERGDEARTEANGSQGSFMITAWLRLQEQEGITSDYTEQRKQKLLCVWKGSNMRTVDAVCKQTSACLHFFLSGPYEAKWEQIHRRAAVNVQKSSSAVFSPSCHVCSVVSRGCSVGTLQPLRKLNLVCFECREPLVGDGFSGQCPAFTDTLSEVCYHSVASGVWGKVKH